MVTVIDDALTERAEPTSGLVGRAQGMKVSAARDAVALLMAMNFVFVEGKYNGSSITVLGRNAIKSEVRKMPVIGGSGLFRHVRGYVQAKTYSFDLKTKNAVVDYNVFVNTHD